MIKLIAFDYADVIAPGPLRQWVTKNLGSDDEKYFYYKSQASKWDVGEMNISQLYEALSRITGIAPNLVWETFYQKSVVDKEVIDIIRSLKKSYKVFLFSNFHGELLRRLLKKHGITELFNEILISSEHKLAKPDPKFFKILMDKSGVEINEILFTDDRIENIDSAKNLGINTIHFKNSKQLKKDLTNFGIVV